MLGVYVAIAALAITVLGLIVKITVFMTEIRSLVGELTAERPVVKRVPMLEYRVDRLERNVDRISDLGE